MNEHTATPTSESVEEAMSKAIEPALSDPPPDRAISLAERIAGLGSPPVGGAIPMQAHDRAIPMPPPERPIAMPPPERAIPMAAPADRVIPTPLRERAAPTPLPEPPMEAARPIRTAAPEVEPVFTPVAPPVARPAYVPPAPALAPIPRVPNRVYEHLVEGDDDVIGLIAYSLYKHDKRQWLMTWRAQHGAEATADQVEAFVNGQMTSGQRERYRTAARQVLDSYALVAVDMEKPQITREAVAGRVEAAARKVEASHRWWRQIPGVLIGAILSVGILIGVIAILVALDFDVGTYLGIAAEPAGETNVVP